MQFISIAQFQITCKKFEPHFHTIQGPPVLTKQVNWELLVPSLVFRYPRCTYLSSIFQLITNNAYVKITQRAYGLLPVKMGTRSSGLQRSMSTIIQTKCSKNEHRIIWSCDLASISFYEYSEPSKIIHYFRHMPNAY